MMRCSSGAGELALRSGRRWRSSSSVIRRRLDETLSYENVAAKAGPARSTLGNLFRDHPREAFLVMALTAGGTAAFYAYSIYPLKFLVNTSGFDRTTASRIMTVALACMLLIQPLAGRLSDHVGRKPLMIFFGLPRPSSHIRFSSRSSILATLRPHSCW